MTDIVERLRRAAGIRSDGDAGLMAKAADEIERLRKELKFDWIDSDVAQPWKPMK